MSEGDPLTSLEELAQQSGRYPVDAFNFIREGLKFTVQRLHKETVEEKHVTGADLCWGLRDYAMQKWGLLAPAVLHRWNISSTMDFGKIVFAMVQAGWMSKRDQDSVKDFDDVFDFRSAFDGKLDIEPEKQDNQTYEE